MSTYLIFVCFFLIFDKKIGLIDQAMNESVGLCSLRRGSYCCWFVDGSDYMSSVADTILLAKREIYITGFFVCPEVYLKKPCTLSSEWRLDRLLHRKAVN